MSARLHFFAFHIICTTFKTASTRYCIMLTKTVVFTQFPAVCLLPWITRPYTKPNLTASKKKHFFVGSESQVFYKMWLFCCLYPRPSHKILQHSDSVHFIQTIWMLFTALPRESFVSRNRPFPRQMRKQIIYFSWEQETLIIVLCSVLCLDNFGNMIGKQCNLFKSD